MGMSTHVMGFIPPNDKFKRMLAAYRACEEAGVEIPDEVQNFFRHDPPDENGVKVPLDHDFAVRVWKDDDRDGYEVDLDKLDPAIRVLRFYNSW
jgi:hypothetical protein